MLRRLRVIIFMLFFNAPNSFSEPIPNHYKSICLTLFAKIFHLEKNSSSSKKTHFLQYPFLYKHRNTVIYRANNVSVNNLEDLNSYLNPGLHPENSGLITEDERLELIKSYLRQGEAGADKLYQDHRDEVIMLHGQHLNLLSSWTTKKTNWFGRQTPKGIRIYAKTLINNDTPLLSSKQSNEYQLIFGLPEKEVSWYLELDNNYYKIVNQHLFANFLQPLHGKLFGHYENMSADEKATFFNNQMSILYKKIKETMEEKIKNGENIGVEKINYDNF